MCTIKVIVFVMAIACNLALMQTRKILHEMNVRVNYRLEFKFYYMYLVHIVNDISVSFKEVRK